MSEADHHVPVVLHACRLPRVPPRAAGVVVRRAFNVDRYLVVGVQEIGAGGALRDQGLRRCGERELVSVYEVESAPLEPGAALA